MTADLSTMKKSLLARVKLFAERPWQEEGSTNPNEVGREIPWDSLAHAASVWRLVACAEGPRKRADDRWRI